VGLQQAIEYLSQQSGHKESNIREKEVREKYWNARWEAT
jgi:hypothetical protein